MPDRAATENCVSFQPTTHTAMVDSVGDAKNAFHSSLRHTDPCRMGPGTPEMRSIPARDTQTGVSGRNHRCGRIAGPMAIAVAANLPENRLKTISSSCEQEAQVIETVPPPVTGQEKLPAIHLVEQPREESANEPAAETVPDPNKPGDKTPTPQKLPDFPPHARWLLSLKTPLPEQRDAG
jgi:hypothetical protein